MLSLVNGPTDVSWMDGTALSTKCQKIGVWVDGWGFTTALDGSWELDLITPSAKVVRIGGRSWWTAHGWSHDDEFVLRYFNGQMQKTKFPSTLPATYEIYTNVKDIILADRSLTFDGQVVRGWPIVDYVGSGIGTIELNTGWSMANGGNIFPADVAANRWWICNWTSGRVRLYDATAKQLVVGRGGTLPVTLPLRNVGYSRALGLFVTLEWDAGRSRNVMSFYAEETVAATLSVPAFSEAPRVGSLRTVRSRLLGSDGEACPDRVVTFSATVGTIAVPSVLTDADGWAETDYTAPMVTSAGETITATLVE